MTLNDTAAQALAEVGEILDTALPDQAGAMVAPIQRARRIVLYGVGREGLMMRALTMRLYHLGLDAHVVGDMTAPPVGPGDLLVVSAGPGEFSTVLALLRVAREAGATTLCVTAQPDGAAPRVADHVVVLDAQTMANDSGGGTSVLPMGSLYELAAFLFFEMLVMQLRDVLPVSPEAMRDRHTNLE